MVRVLVPYGRTLFYTDKGRERGLTADLVREFEEYLNRTRKTGRRPLTVYIVPTTRDKLLQNVADGLGDLAAGNLTITAGREQVVDFVQQEGRTVDEVVVTGAKAAPLASLLLAGGGLLIAIDSVRRGSREPAAMLVLCGASATLVVLAIHLDFTFARHLETGWLKGIYPRYYFPLLVIIPAACAIAVARLRSWPIAALIVAASLGFAGLSGLDLAQAVF